MFLSLFLLLLAFFILLNSLSTLKETKSRAVLSSVSATFRTEDISEISAEILVSTLGPVPEPAAVIDEVERLWLTAVPVTRVERVTAGDDMILDLPVTQLFVGAEARVRDDRTALIDATASALAARLEGSVVETQAVFHVTDLTDDPAPPRRPADAAEAEPDIVDLDDPGASFLPANAMDGMPLAMSRTEALAQALIDAGAPPDGLTVGLREGNPTKLRLRFFVRDAAAARLTFSQAATEADAAAGRDAAETAR